MNALADLVRAHTREIADFPTPGIAFQDLSPLFAAPGAFGEVIDAIAAHWAGRVDLIAGVEARGFILAPPVALRLGLPFVPVRKAGKLPGDLVAQEYDLEYGSATIEVQRAAVPAGRRVLVLDDVLATGGTAAAAAQLVERCGATVAGYAFLLELGALQGRSALRGEVQVALTV